MSETKDSDSREVTEEDAIVQTASGERYRAAEVSKSGETREDD